MSIVSVLEQFLNRGGDGGYGAERNYTRIWRVVVDSLLVDSYTVLNAPGLPSLYELYVGSDGSVDDEGATLRKLTAENIEPFVWEVKGTYSNKTEQKERGDPNPLNRPTDISSSGVTFQKPIDFTPDGTPVCTSTNERFDPPVTRDDSRLNYLFVRKEAQSIASIAYVYKDVVNSDTFLGNPPGTCKTGVITESRADENNQFYWKVSYPIAVDLDGWNARPMDEGSYWLDSEGDMHHFVDAHNMQLPSPQPLNGEGGPLRPQGFNARFAQGANSTLAAVVDVGDTTITVANATGFPQLSTTYPIVLQVGTELMLATGLSGSTFTVKRGYGGTTPGGYTDLTTEVQMAPYYLNFQRYRWLPFAALKLP